MTVKSIPKGEVGDSPVIHVPCPYVAREKSTGEVKFNDDGTPRYGQSPHHQRYANEKYPVFVSRLFLLHHVFSDDALTNAEVTLLLYLASNLRYASPQIVHEENGEPIPVNASGTLVKAVLRQLGNRVPARTFEDIRKGTRIKSDDTIRRAIEGLKARGIIDEYEASQPIRQREPGRPERIWRLDIHPEYVFSGPMAAAVGFQRYVQKHQSDRFMPTHPNWRPFDVQG